MNIHFETEDYLIRDIEESDVEGIFLLDSDPEVQRFVGNRPITSMDQAEEIVHRARQQYEQFGLGRWAIIDKKSNDFVGWTGIKYEQRLREEFDYYDLGYRLRKAYWGKGIASLTAIESLRYGFDKLNLKKIHAAADVEHVVSNHILQKVGLKYIETFEFDNLPHHWYGIERDDWFLLNL